MEKRYKNTEQMQEVEKRFEFVITLAIFIPTLIAILLKFVNIQDQNINKSILQWSVAIGVYLISYFIFQYSKKILGPRILEYLRHTLLAATVCYGISVLYIANAGSGFLNFLEQAHVFILKSSVFLLIALPFVILLLVLIDPVRKLVSLIKK